MFYSQVITRIRGLCLSLLRHLQSCFAIRESAQKARSEKSPSKCPRNARFFSLRLDCSFFQSTPFYFHRWPALLRAICSFVLIAHVFRKRGTNSPANQISRAGGGGGAHFENSQCKTDRPSTGIIQRGFSRDLNSEPMFMKIHHYFRLV